MLVGHRHGATWPLRLGAHKGVGRMSTDQASTDQSNTYHVATVAVLLSEAGLDVPPEEIKRLADLYGGLRRSIDRFHDIDAGDEVMAAVFRADEARPGSAG